MPEYRVTWRIDLAADNSREAAEKAQAILSWPGSIARVFDVVGEEGESIRVDLDEPAVGPDVSA